MVAHAFNLSTRKAKVTLAYRVSSRTGSRAAQRSPVLKKEGKQEALETEENIDVQGQIVTLLRPIHQNTPYIYRGRLYAYA